MTNIKPHQVFWYDSFTLVVPLHLVEDANGNPPDEITYNGEPGWRLDTTKSYDEPHYKRP